MKTKPRIVHFLSDMGGGATRSALDLARATREEVENIFVILEEKDLFDIEFDRHVLVSSRNVYKKLDFIGDIILANKLKKILDNIGVDIVVSHMESTAKILKYIPKKRVFYIRVDISNELDLLKSKSIFRYIKRMLIYKWVLNNENLICISEETKNNVLKYISPRKIETIYNPFDFEKINKLSKERIVFNDEYIVQVGGDFNRKRQDVLLEAFSKLSDKHIKLMLLGTDINDRVLSCIKKFGIDRNRIIFVPFKKNPYPYIKRANLLVISSEREGLPRVMIEALGLDTPVVSTDCDTGPREIMVGELACFLAKVNDPDSLAKKIEIALKTYPPIGPKYLRSFGRKEISKKFINYIDNIL